MSERTPLLAKTASGDARQGNGATDSHTARSPTAVTFSTAPPTIDSATPSTPSFPDRMKALISRVLALYPPLQRLYLMSFLNALTFSFTQTSMVYSYRTMTCDEYYKTAPPFEGDGDRCAVREVERQAASAVALMSTITVVGTIFNLFKSTYFMEKYGIKFALFQQTGWAALRNLVQTYSQIVGGRTGVLLMTAGQLLNALGSGGGYQLCANAYVSAISSDDDRTANFGRISGVFMLGSGFGYSLGGFVERSFGPLAPFFVAFWLLVFCTLYALVALPYIAPEASRAAIAAKKKRRNSDAHRGSGSHRESTREETLEEQVEREKRTVFTPLKVFVPRRVTDPISGKTRIDYNLFLLGSGVFCSVLATGYINMAQQLVATNMLGFTPDTTGMMLSLSRFARAFFLSICFPRIIAKGRELMAARVARQRTLSRKIAAANDSETTTRLISGPITSSPTASVLSLPETQDDTEADESKNNSDTETDTDSDDIFAPARHASVADPTGEPITDGDRPPRSTETKGSAFDLIFLRQSIMLDGLLTGMITFASTGWHMFLAAAVLPFASGTAPAAKGVIMEIVPPQSRSDALSGITLLEKIAQVAGISIFGYVFNAVSAAGKPTLVFAVDGAVALLAFAMLLPVRLNRNKGSTVVV